jgi:hypothetical protein
MEKDRWVEHYHLVSAFPIYRKTDAVFAHKDKNGEVSISRDAIMGVQLFRVTHLKYKADTSIVLEKEKDPELNYCFMRAIENGEEYGQIGPDSCVNIIGYDIEGIDVTEEMWIERAKKYFERGGEE